MLLSLYEMSSAFGTEVSQKKSTVYFFYNENLFVPNDVEKSSSISVLKAEEYCYRKTFLPLISINHLYFYFLIEKISESLIIKHLTADIICPLLNLFFINYRKLSFPLCQKLPNEFTTSVNFRKAKNCLTKIATSVK